MLSFLILYLLLSMNYTRAALVQLVQLVFWPPHKLQLSSPLPTQYPHGAFFQYFFYTQFDEGWNFIACR